MENAAGSGMVNKFEINNNAVQTSNQDPNNNHLLSEEDINDDFNEEHKRQTPMTLHSINNDKILDESYLSALNSGTKIQKQDSSLSSQYARMIKERQHQWEQKLTQIQRQVE